MDTKRISAVFIAIFVGVSTMSMLRAWAEDEDGVLRISPENMRWQKWGTSQRTMLFGNPADFDCPYVDRVKFPAGYKVDGHSFQQDKEFTVISGVVLVGIGRSWDESKLQSLPAGSFWRIPAGVSYFFRAESEVLMQTSTRAVPGRDCSTKQVDDR